MTSSSPGPRRTRAARPAAASHPSAARVSARLWLGARLAAVLVLLASTACAEAALAPFGNLDTPVSLAVHQPTGQVFIALQGTNDLRVFDTRENDFLIAPAELFPLSIPTVRTPIEVAAAERFVFVVSGATAEVGFVDTLVPPGASGPRSVDGPDGFPITIALDQVPTSAAAFSAAFGFAEEGTLSDHLVVAGLSPVGTGGELTVVRPPHATAGGEDLPSIAAHVSLPGAAPSGIALDVGVASPEGVFEDCRTVAVADADPTTGGVIFSRVRVLPGGSVSLDTPGAADAVEIRVPVTMPDGTVVSRRAGARAVAFGPAPEVPGIEAALAADPCAVRAGRLFVVLDPAFCTGASICPNVAVLDLDGTPTLATDAVTGGPAAFATPAAALGVVALQGPFRFPSPKAFDPASIGADDAAAQVVGLPELTLVTSSDGAITYLAGGLGPFLLADGSRAVPDPVFLLSASPTGPRVPVPPVRTDVRRAPLPAVAAPVVEVPPGARPRNETWTAGFEAPLPGFANVGSLGQLGTTLTLPQGSTPTFASPVPIHASADPLLADRVVPLPPAPDTTVCDGFPIVAVSPDGLTVTVNRQPPGFDNPAGCTTGDVPLAILPPRGLPWTLAGSVTGFAGRVAAAPLPVGVFSGGTLLFRFTPSIDVPRGATFQWQTSSGFSFYRADPQTMGLMPASIAAVLTGGVPGIDPAWRVFVAYSGADAVMRLNPQTPAFSDLTFIQ